ncbi:MAG TPA: cysteine synthase A [Planctomycetota bacterium]|nr:cysteine synthase A [Planctomycetota bacterium]
MKPRPPIADSVIDLIGHTPLVRLRRLPPPGCAEICAKLESFNPCWSVKDRIGAAMIEDAERAGKIAPDRTTIVEPTSGNTGIGLAMAAAAKGYKTVFTLPETMTQERRRVLLAFGATIVITPGPKGMKGAIAKAQEIAAKTPGAWIPSQFDNPANVDVHRRTTGPEILEATGGRLDAFVAGVGTGGTVSGTGEVLKERVPGVKVIAVESADSPLLSGGAHVRGNRIQGISPGFIPGNYRAATVDRVITVAYEDAIATSRRLCREEGIFVGISAGAVTWAAIQAGAELGAGKRVVAVLPDLGERYLSHELFTATADPERIIDATKE